MADDARMELLFKIRAQTDEALREIRALTGETEGMGNKTKQATDKANDGFGGLTERLKGMATPLAAVGAATAAVAAAMEAARQAAAAMNREMERTGNASRDYQDSLSILLSNMKGAGPQEKSFISSSLLQIAAQYPLGAQGPSAMNLAMASAKGALPTSSNRDLLAVVREVAQEMSMNPSIDPAGMALGIGKIVAAGGGTIDANYAQNLMGLMQGQGLVADPTAVAGMIPALASASQTAGVSLPEMMAVAAAATQISGDQMGTSTATQLQVAMGKIMNNNAEISKSLGVSLRGRNALERLSEIAGLRASGVVSDDQLQAALPALGGEGRFGDFLRFATTQAGQAELMRSRQAVTAPAFRRRDLTGEDLAFMAALPGGAERLAADRAASALAARRAGDSMTSGLSFDKDRVQMELEAMGFNESGVRAGVAKFLGMRRQGASVADAEAAARGAANIGALPFGVGAAYGGLAEAESGGKPFLGPSAGTGGVPTFYIGTLQMQTNDTRRVQDQIMEDAGFPLSAGGGG